MRPGSRAAVRAVAMVAASLAVGLLLGEGALRVLDLYPPVAMHRMPPGSVQRDRQSNWDVVYRTNSQGMRDREHDVRRPADVRLRIVVVGDSFTFGQGVESNEAFPSVLETLLRDRGRAVEVINVSNIGIGAESYFVLLRDVGLRYEPDLVVLNVFGNDASTGASRGPVRAALRDLSDSLHVFALLRAFRAAVARRETIEITRDPGAFWRKVEESCAEHHAREACRDALERFRAAHGGEINNLAAGCLDDPEDVRRWIDTDERGEWWRDFREYLAEIRRISLRAGARLVVGIVPDGAQVDRRQLSLRRELLVDLPDSVLSDEGPFQRSVAGLCRELDLPCYDPLRSFREAGGTLYLDGDLHWTVAGHRRYAAGLADFLEERSLLDAVDRAGAP